MVINLNNIIKSIIITIISSFVLGTILGAFLFSYVSSSIVFFIAIICGILIGIFCYIVFIYNDLIKAKNNVENSWAQIDVQLKRRIDLIPNIVETVKGYAEHENETFVNIAKARAGLESATTVKDTVKANNMLTNTLMSLFAVVENYPELKANSNFQDLQNQLKEIEKEIANQRTVFNSFVMKYNNLCEQFPSNIIANKFNFKVADYFHTNEEERNTPKVKF